MLFGTELHEKIDAILIYVKNKLARRIGRIYAGITALTYWESLLDV